MNKIGQTSPGDFILRAPAVRINIHTHTQTHTNTHNGKDDDDAGKAVANFCRLINRRQQQRLDRGGSMLGNAMLLGAGCSAQCAHCTVFFPFDRARWDISSNLKTVILLNIYLSQRARSKGILRKVDFREPQTLNLWFSLKYSPVVTTKYAPLFPCYSPVAMVIPL